MKLQFSTIKIWVFVCLMAWIGTAAAQQIVQVSIGQGYGRQSFYKLSNDDTTMIGGTSWDLAFTVYGLQDAGVHLNETSVTNFAAPAAQMELYLTSATDWSVTPDTANLGSKQWNLESTWAYGAFNNSRSPANPFDYGWGVYSPQQNQVVGSKIFVIKLLTGEYRKLQIQSLVHPNYTFRHAKLDGSDEKTVTVNKAAFPGKVLAYYSFALDSVLDLSPAAHDLWFGRYFTPLDDSTGTGTFVDYSVTGVLHNRGVTVAEVRGVAPASAQAPTRADSFKTRLDIIGHDWKTFNFQTGWTIQPDQTFFVKTADQNLWKLVFIDFEGSTTGVITFEKTDLGTFTSLDAEVTGVAGWKAFPTRVTDELNVSVDATRAGSAAVQILTTDGRVVRSYQQNIQPGLQVWALEGLSGLANGVYLIGLEINGQRHYQRFVVAQ